MNQATVGKLPGEHSKFDDYHIWLRHDDWLHLQHTTVPLPCFRLAHKSETCELTGQSSPPESQQEEKLIATKSKCSSLLRPASLTLQ